MYRTLIPYEKISRFTTATRSVADEQLPRKAALYQLGSPPIAAKLPIVTPRRLMSKDRFQELKDLIRYNKNRETTADNETISVISTPAVSSNDTGKKRPGYYESMMTRPRHFSDAHYMNKMKPNGDNIDNSLTVTVATSHVISFFFFHFNIVSLRYTAQVTIINIRETMRVRIRCKTSVFGLFFFDYHNQSRGEFEICVRQLFYWTTRSPHTRLNG